MTLILCVMLQQLVVRVGSMVVQHLCRVMKSPNDDAKLYSIEVRDVLFWQHIAIIEIPSRRYGRFQVIVMTDEDKSWT